MSSGVQHCPFCGGRLRLVKVINVDTSRKADFLASSKSGTQELMCASCGSRVALDYKQPASSGAKAETAGASAAAQKQASVKSDIAAAVLVLIGIAALAVLGYFTYKNSAKLLEYWDSFVALVERGIGFIANLKK